MHFESPWISCTLAVSLKQIAFGVLQTADRVGQASFETSRDDEFRVGDKAGRRPSHLCRSSNMFRGDPVGSGPCRTHPKRPETTLDQFGLLDCLGEDLQGRCLLLAGDGTAGRGGGRIRGGFSIGVGQLVRHY